jgi:hypothetical protein
VNCLRDARCDSLRSSDSEGTDGKMHQGPGPTVENSFFSALHALAVNDAGGGAGFSFPRLAAFDVKRVMQTIERAVPIPQAKVTVHGAARGKVLGKITPLAARAQHIHHAVHDGAHINAPLTAAAFGGRNERFDMRPLIIRHIARVSQMIAVVSLAVLVRPHRRFSRIEPASLESQMVLLIQLSRGTLRGCCCEPS